MLKRTELIVIGLAAAALAIVIFLVNFFGDDPDDVAILPPQPASKVEISEVQPGNAQGDAQGDDRSAGSDSGETEPESRLARVDPENDRTEMPQTGADAAGRPVSESPRSGADINAEGLTAIDIVRVEPSGEVLVAGRSDAGAIVGLVEDGKVLGKGLANDAGEFVITLDKPLAPGVHDLAVETSAADGDAPARRARDIVVVIQAPESEEQPLVLLDRQGAASEILQKPEADADADAQTPGEPAVVAVAQPAPQAGQNEDDASQNVTVTPVVEAVESENDTVYIAGSGEPEAEVQVYVENKLVGGTKSDAAGRWLIEAKKELPAEQVEVRVDQLDSATREVTARASVTFLREEGEVVLRPAMLTATASGTAGVNREIAHSLPRVIIRRGDNLWTISRRRYGRGIRYTTIYLANKNQIRNPDLIYPGQVFVMPQGDRNWSE